MCTHSDDLAERLRVLRNHGRSGSHRHEVLGYSSRLDEIQAAVLRVKLRYVDRFNVARRGVAHRYNRLLTGLDLVLPHEDPAGFHVFHQYTVLCDERDTLIGALGTEDVASAVHYRIPLHRQGAFSPFCVGVSMPVSEGVAERCLSLPIYPEMPEEQIVRVAEVVTATLA